MLVRPGVLISSRNPAGYEPGRIGSPADASLSAESQGLALSFTDTFFLNSSGHYGSARVKDTSTPANNYNSHPFGLVTYAGASKKWVRGPSGLLIESDPALTLPYEWGVNEFVNPDSPETQMISVDDESSYTVVVEGSGSVTLSGAAAGTVAAGQVRTFKMDGTSLTVTVNGSPTFVHVSEALGIRVEEQRTNLITWSQDFSKWSTANALVTYAGDGLWKVERAEDATEGRLHAVYFLNANYADSDPIQRSHFIDIVRGNTRYVYLLAKRSFSDINDRRMIVDLDTLTITANDFAHDITRATAEDIGGGVIRLSVTCNTDTVGGGTRANLGLGTCNSPTNILDVSVGEYVYAVRAQSEDGSFPTSYIPTAGSTVTRAADAIGPALDKFPWNEGNGVLTVNDEEAEPSDDGTILLLEPPDGDTHIRTVKWIPEAA